MTPQIMKGLKRVYVDTTQASFIDGEKDKLLYCGYNFHDLAVNSSLALRQIHGWTPSGWNNAKTTYCSGHYFNTPVSWIWVACPLSSETNPRW